MTIIEFESVSILNKILTEGFTKGRARGSLIEVWQFQKLKSFGLSELLNED